MEISFFLNFSKEGTHKVFEGNGGHARALGATEKIISRLGFSVDLGRRITLR